MSGRYAGVPVLVTGAAGFIGSHLTRALVREGARVTALLRPGSDPWRLTGLEPSVSFLEADIVKRESLQEAVIRSAPRVVFHLAARVDVQRDLKTAADLFTVNLGGTLSLIEALANLPGCRMINLGTSDEYGNGPSPFREEQAPRPVSPYGVAKAAATMAAVMAHATANLQAVTVRPFLTYGPGQTSDMLVPYTIRGGLKGDVLRFTSGEQTRDFVYVDDVVEGLLRAGVYDNLGGEIINLGSGVEVQVREVVETILALVGGGPTPEFGALSYRPGEAMHFYSDSTKALRLLGWQAEMPLEEGLKRTIVWWRSFEKI